MMYQITGFIFFFSMLSHCYSLSNSFVEVSPITFLLDGKPFYVNGFNAYWMPYLALENQRMVSDFLKQAGDLGLNVARTMAFRDGGDNAMQTSLGEYNEQALQGLDFVVSEVSKNNMTLILSFVNNYNDLGGRPQYVKWAKEAGINVTTDDDFYTDPIVKQFYKDYVEMILTRKNTITGLTYRDDPTIFSWELMNEPRSNDISGEIVQSWILEMASFVKSLDSNHLLEIGLEGFYNVKNMGSLNSRSAGIGSWGDVGTDFLRNNMISDIDFATVHIYPNAWMPFEEQLSIVIDSMAGHIRDASKNLSKPLLFTEFGSKQGNRQLFFSTMYSSIYTAAKNGLACAGGLLWQLFPNDMSRAWGDEYLVLVSNDTSIIEIIRAQSERMRMLNHSPT